MIKLKSILESINSADVLPGVNIRNETGARWADMIIDGVKTIETRPKPTLNSLRGKRVKVIRTGEGRAQVIGEVTFDNGGPIVYDSLEKFNADVDKHFVKVGSGFMFDDIKYGYQVSDPVRYKESYDAPIPRGIVTSREVPGPRNESINSTDSIDDAYMKAVESGDMKAAQKMVDDAAAMQSYSIKMWHYTRDTRGFNVFDKDKSGGVFYFSRDKEYGKSFGDRLISVYIDLGPKVLDTRELKVNDLTPDEFVNWMKSKGVDINSSAEALRGRHLKRDRVPFWGYLRSLSEGGLIDDIKRAGYSSVFQIEQTYRSTPSSVVAVFDASQIKLADPVTKDKDGNIIPISKRFDYHSDDIRNEVTV